MVILCFVLSHEPRVQGWTLIPEVQKGSYDLTGLISTSVSSKEELRKCIDV